MLAVVVETEYFDIFLKLLGVTRSRIQNQANLKKVDPEPRPKDDADPQN